MICDISKWQGAIDWSKLAPVLDFVAIKASGKEKDPCFDRNAAEAVAHGVPWHAYHFLYCTTEARARAEAKLFSDSVGRFTPLFWVLDCEGAWGVAKSKARKIAEAFEAELRRLRGAAIRVAVYIGHNVYKDYALDYDHYAYVWIPRYRKVDQGLPNGTRPDYKCDLWQYSSKGKAPGISGNVDLNMIIGDKPLEFFTDPEKYEKKESDTMATVKIGSARIDENGKATGGKAGDQTGKEVSTQNWYKHAKGWRVLRAKDPEAAEKIAQAMQWACDSPLIGYDQYQRETLRKAVMPLGWDIRRLSVAVETDCSALVRVCCGWAFQRDLGASVSYFNTTTMCSALLKTGLFDELTGSKYTDQQDYLRRGDILCTRTQGHTVVVLSNGSKAEAVVVPVTPTESAPDGLRRGDKGDDVRAMQRALMIWKSDCLPRWGADGDFGQETEDALRAYQASAGLPVTGIYDDATRTALTAIGRMQYVRITGGSVNVRSAPGTGYKVLGIVHQDYRLPYHGEKHMMGETPWYCVAYDNQMGWVSGKFAEVIEG